MTTTKLNKKDTHYAVETSIGLAKKKGTWEGINKNRSGLSTWDNMTRNDFLEVLKKVSRPIEQKSDSEL